MIKHVRPAVIMMIFSATRKESGSLMIIAATNGSQKRRYIGVTACCSDSLERGEMMEKIASRQQPPERKILRLRK